MGDPLFSLVDCNSFYASCELVFEPRLRGIPLVVLSNNDGCVVARSAEAKALGVPMGAPAFQLRDLTDSGRLVARSSNYTLYGDLSARTMSVLAAFGARQEVYSIDECFLDVSGCPDPAGTMGKARETALRWTGIPVSVGIGPTKTLAKLASERAKKLPGGVYQTPLPGPELDALLRSTPTEDIWGVGGRTAEALASRGISDALALARCDDATVRSRFGVVGLRTVLELRGEPCLGLEDLPPPKKSLCVSRSFGEDVGDPGALAAAVATFAEKACAKLRRAGLAATAATVWLEGNRFRDGSPPTRSATLCPPTPASDTGTWLHLALGAVHRLAVPGERYKKAGVLLLGLVDASAGRQELIFDPDAGLSRDRAERLWKAVDAVNRYAGPGSLRSGTSLRSDRWRPAAANVSPRYTTRWEELPRATC